MDERGNHVETSSIIDNKNRYNRFEIIHRNIGIDIIFQNPGRKMPSATHTQYMVNCTAFSRVSLSFCLYSVRQSINHASLRQAQTSSAVADGFRKFYKKAKSHRQVGNSVHFAVVDLKEVILVRACQPCTIQELQHRREVLARHLFFRRCSRRS